MLDRKATSLKKLHLRRLLIVVASFLTAVTVCACVCLKLVSDVMADRAQTLEEAGRRARLTEDVRTGLHEFSRISNLLVARPDSERERRRSEVLAHLYRDLDQLEPTALPIDSPLI